jgi:small-conductance mechanosensitive channel
LKPRTRSVFLIALSPIILILGIAAVWVGMAYVGGYDPAQTLGAAVDAETVEMQQLAVLSVRCLLIPFQLIFIGLVVGVLLVLLQRSRYISNRLIDPLVARDPSEEDPTVADPDANDREQLIGIRPGRQVTLTQIGGSLLAAVGLLIAFVLIAGQFLNLTDLAIVVTALTTAITWGARMPVSDLLGGFSNLVENNFNVGDRLSYRHFNLDIEGVVAAVNLRFTALHAVGGERVTIPFGEIRTFRNFSRSTFAGVYVTFPVPSASLQQVVDDFERLAADYQTLIPDLLGPWRVICQDGVLAPTVELSLYGRGPVGQEENLQVALHTIVWKQLQTYNMGTGPEEAA